MNRDQIIEAMARAICDQWGYVWDGDPEDDQTAPDTNVDYDDRPSKELYRQAATAALAAIEAAGAVLTPREPTSEMIAAAWRAWHARNGGKLGPGPAFVEALTGGIAASPFKETT